MWDQNLRFGMENLHPAKILIKNPQIKIQLVCVRSAIGDRIRKSIIPVRQILNFEQVP